MARTRLGNAGGAVVAAELGPVASAIYAVRETACSSAGRAIVRAASNACERPATAAPPPSGARRILYAVFTAGLSEGFRHMPHAARARNALLTGGVSEVICQAGKEKTELAMDLVCDGDVGKLLPKPKPGADPYTPSYDVAARGTPAREGDDLVAALRSPQMGMSLSEARRAARFLAANGLASRPLAQRIPIALLYLTTGAQAALAAARQQAAVSGLSHALHGWAG